MRLAMFLLEGRRAIGAALDGSDHFFGLRETHDDYPGDLDDLIQQGRDLAETGQRLLAADPVSSAEAPAPFLVPLIRSSKILCVGLNYADHSAETGFDVPEHPVIFTRFASSLLAADAPLVRPAESDQFDFEGELVAIIGRGGKHIPVAEALNHIAAYSLFNDASVRDYQFRTPQWTIGKNFDGTGAFGPWIVTVDALPPGAAGLTLTTRLNDDIMQQASTDTMIFNVAQLVSRLSATLTLTAGDVIVTGTPAGIGMSRNPPRFMRPGDVCEISIDQIRTLRNSIVSSE